MHTQGCRTQLSIMSKHSNIKQRTSRSLGSAAIGSENMKTMLSILNGISVPVVALELAGGKNLIRIVRGFDYSMESD